jgi:hypothetical protein
MPHRRRRQVPWGDNLGGQLGTGDVTSDPNPTPRAVHDLSTS